MASYYNGRVLIGEVLVAGERHAVIRPTQAPAVLQALDQVPHWLEGG
jgi:hypothetical protein